MTAEQFDKQIGKIVDAYIDAAKAAKSAYEADMGSLEKEAKASGIPDHLVEAIIEAQMKRMNKRADAELNA